jgi:hypothetical protein
MKLIALLILLFSFNPAEKDFSNENEISISLEELKDVNTIYELINLKEKNCQVFRFTIFQLMENGEAFEIINRGNVLNNRVKQKFQQAKKGDEFHLDDFDSLGDCIQYQFRYKNFKITINE